MSVRKDAEAYAPLMDQWWTVRRFFDLVGNIHEVFVRHYGDKAREDELKAAADAVLKNSQLNLRTNPSRS